MLDNTFVKRWIILLSTVGLNFCQTLIIPLSNVDNTFVKR